MPGALSQELAGVLSCHFPGDRVLTCYEVPWLCGISIHAALPPHVLLCFSEQCDLAQFRSPMLPPGAIDMASGKWDMGKFPMSRMATALVLDSCPLEP